MYLSLDTKDKVVILTLKTKNVEVTEWEKAIHDSLHSVQSLLCTVMNNIPHERFFKYCCRSSSCCTMPTWLASRGPALLKQQVWHSKMNPLVDEVEVLEVSPQYTHAKLQNGRVTTVSLKQLQEHNMAAALPEDGPSQEPPPPLDPRHSFFRREDQREFDVYLRVFGIIISKVF